MSAPMIKRFTRALPAALGAFVFATDDETGLVFLRVNGSNAIIDVVNSPDPAAGLTYQINIWKNGVDTGRRWFSEAMSPASAGRMSMGGIALSQGDYYFSVAQTAGALTATSFIIKLSKAP